MSLLYGIRLRLFLALHSNIFLGFFSFALPIAPLRFLLRLFSITSLHPFSTTLSHDLSSRPTTILPCNAPQRFPTPLFSEPGLGSSLRSSLDRFESLLLEISCTTLDDAMSTGIGVIFRDFIHRLSCFSFAFLGFCIAFGAQFSVLPLWRF